MSNVYVRTAEGSVKVFKNLDMRMSTNGTLCIVSGGQYGKLIHAFPEGTWTEASTNRLIEEI